MSDQPCPYVTGEVTRHCTLTPLTLTDAERGAVMTLISCGEQSEDVGDQHAAATLRGLLERLG